MTRYKRITKGAVTLGALALVAAACGGDEGESASGHDAVSFVQPVQAGGVYFPSMVAEELGFFEEQGIDAELLVAGDITEATLIDQGDADVAFTGFAEVSAGLEAGIDMEVVWDGYHQAAEGVVVPEGSDLQDMGDLEGQTVGLASDSDLAFLNVALGFAGLGPDSVSPVVVGTSGGTVASALESGEIVAFAGAASDFAAMQGAGLELRFITPEEMEANPGGSAIVQSSQIEDRPDVLERFLRAWAMGQHVGVVAPDVVEAINREVAPIEFENEAVGVSSLEGSINRFTPENDVYGEIRADTWESAVAQLVDSGEIADPVPTDEYLNDQFVEAANDFDREAVEATAQEWMDENG